MPELPEVESARTAIERAALDRRIVDMDDTDRWVCRPHPPGEIRAALVGRRLTAARRQGKTMWCETSGTARSPTPGPVLGLHLGMSGHVLITDGGGELIEGGDWLGSRTGRAAARAELNPVWVRFRLVFADGGELRLFDQRRLGRVRLDPDVEQLGPDAAAVDRREFAERVGRGRAPVKARLLDQTVVAGVVNLLADETHWQARISLRRPADERTVDELHALRRALRAATAPRSRMAVSTPVRSSNSAARAPAAPAVAPRGAAPPSVAARPGGARPTSAEPFSLLPRDVRPARRRRRRRRGLPWPGVRGPRGRAAARRH